MEFDDSQNIINLDDSILRKSIEGSPFRRQVAENVDQNDSGDLVMLGTSFDFTPTEKPVIHMLRVIPSHIYPS